MSVRFTKHSFYRYAKCPSWIAHDARHGHPEDALRIRLQEDGLLPEVERSLLEKRGTIVAEVATDDLDEGMKQTFAYMREGVQTIYRPVLMLNASVARPDFLERVQGASNFGDYYYIACDIKRSRAIKPEYKLQGCFYADVLEMIQKTKPVQGYVMNSRGEIQSYILADAEVEYRLSKDAILRILDGEEEPHFLTSDCKQSPWFSACKADTVSCDDISRVNRIWRSEVDALRSAGFTTLTAFAQAHPDLIFGKVPGITRERIAFLHMQARSLFTGQVTVVRPPVFPPSEQCLVIDVESDPLRDADYLFGVLVVEGDRTEYKEFLAKNPKDERKAWEEFIGFIRSYISYPLYHYGWSEQDIFRRLGEKYGTDKEVLSMLEDQGVDLLVRLRDSVIFPLSFYSLKDIAQYLGFSWRRDDASGLNSVLWYERWLTQGDESALKDVVMYNEDDVRATLHVLRWAERQRV
jgi:predicted RecB family nuclease